MHNKTKNQLINIISERDNKISELNWVISDRDSTIEQINTTTSWKDEKIDTLNIEISEKDETIQNFETEINNSKDDISEKTEAINELSLKLEEFEVKKFAQAFESEKEEYNGKLKIWTKLSIISFILLFISTVIVVYISFEAWIEKKISLFFIDFIFVVFTVFSVKQYSYFTNHYSKSLEKQTLAQWYHNILKSWEDWEIKEEFREKLVDILCSKNELKNKNNLPIEQLFNTLENLSKNNI